MSASRLVAAYRTRARAKRARIFRRHISLADSARVLDLGSQDGSHIHSLLPAGMDVYIADINAEAVQRGAERFGYSPVVIPENGKLPFPDGFFDVVFCSSVIEHVTPVGKDDCWKVTDGRWFRRESRLRQSEFADEVRRIGKHFFVQTPSRWFPVESHSWLPGVALLPRPVLIRLLRWSNRWWIKKTSPDWHLLTRREMRHLFPDAAILSERSLGFVKSYIAIRAQPPS